MPLLTFRHRAYFHSQTVLCLGATALNCRKYKVNQVFLLETFYQLPSCETLKLNYCVILK
jgi:hypothetical protein